jgi:mannose-6-phosphate isomerase-like protein (cupin superfamily)
MSMKVVVTGHGQHGSPVFTEETQLIPLTAAGFPAIHNVPVWEAAVISPLPYSGGRAPVGTFFPPAGAYRFFYLTIDPDDATAGAQVPSAANIDEFEALFPALLSAYELEAPGMHASDTIDLITVTSGSVVLDLGDGGERTLAAGDAVVQHGTRHRWRNDGPEPVTMVVFMIGVPRATMPVAAVRAASRGGAGDGREP